MTKSPQKPAVSINAEIATRFQARCARAGIPMRQALERLLADLPEPDPRVDEWHGLTDGDQ